MAQQTVNFLDGFFERFGFRNCSTARRNSLFIYILFDGLHFDWNPGMILLGLDEIKWWIIPELLENFFLIKNSLLTNWKTTNIFYLEIHSNKLIFVWKIWSKETPLDTFNQF